MKNNRSQIRLRSGFLLALALIFVLSLSSLSSRASADDLWNDSIYHIGDFMGVLTDEAEAEFNSRAEAYITGSEFDYVVMIVGADNYGESEVTDYFDYIYAKNSLGYGPGRDGMLLGLDADRENVVIRLYGRANTVLSRADIDSLYQTVREAYRTGGYEGAVDAFLEEAYRMVSSTGTTYSKGPVSFEDTFHTRSVPLSSDESGTAPLMNGVEMPGWYVVDAEHFVDFHNTGNEPRLIDNADILTQEEEAQVAARLAKLRQETNQDIVIYTDTTSYGLDNELYEMDFYVYNGYGVGPDFDGIMLFVNMDPANREMVTTAFGAPREVFTAYTSNQLDDILYDHLVLQQYADAFLDWTVGVENLLKYGVVDMPAWYGAYLSGEPAIYGDTRLVNEVGGISDSDTTLIEKDLQRLSETYDTDVVVYLTHKIYNLTGTGGDEEVQANEYLDLFWQAGGYGYGDDHRGILLGIFVDESSLYKIQVREYGSGGLGKAKELSENAEKRLEDLTILNLGSGNYEYNINRYLRYLSKFMKWGYLPHTPFVRGFWAVLCAIAGGIFGGILTGKAKKKNNAIREATHADAYLVPNSFRILGAQNIHIGTRVTARTIKRDTDSDSRSSSSGSRSSYSSSSSSSSGRSGSTSRRSF